MAWNDVIDFLTCEDNDNHDDDDDDDNLPLFSVVFDSLGCDSQESAMN